MKEPQGICKDCFYWDKDVGCLCDIDRKKHARCEDFVEVDLSSRGDWFGRDFSPGGDAFRGQPGPYDGRRR
jgi:hypothetical protein